MIPLITDPALDDLNEIWEALAEFNLEYANRIISSLVEQILRLADFPESHPVVMNTVGAAIRRLNVGTWAVFDTIDAGRPTVVRILSGRRDLGRVLGGLGEPPTT